MDTEKFLALLRKDGTVHLDRDISDEALDGFFGAETLAEGIEALRRYGCSELEIGFVVGYDTYSEIVSPVPKRSESVEMMFG